MTRRLDFLGGARPERLGYSDIIGGNIPRNLFLNVARDPDGKLWGVARICLADGSCLTIESRIYRDGGSPAANDSPIYAGADDDELDEEPAQNKALDEALDKLCKLTQNKAIMRAIPLPARLALRLVCTARNAQKIKRAAENEGDEEEAAGAKELLRQFKTDERPLVRRAYNALRLWQ